VELDHILLAVRDLDEAAEHLARDHGLTSYVGGVHPRWGTANRIVPLDDSYLELIAVVDDRTAAATDVGRLVMKGASTRGAPIGWAVRPDDLDAAARRLGLEPHDGSRARDDGTIVRWRMAGIERTVGEPHLPWLIEWNEQGTYPGRAEVPLAAHVVRIELEGDSETLDAWLGSHTLPLDVHPGTAGVTAVVLDGPRGTVALGRPTKG
jgi:Glyoxalase-like domain